MKFQNPSFKMFLHTRTSRNIYAPNYFKVGRKRDECRVGRVALNRSIEVFLPRSSIAFVSKEPLALRNYYSTI